MKDSLILFLIVASMVFAGCVGGPQTTTTQTTANTIFAQTTIGEGPATLMSTTSSDGGGAANLAAVHTLVIDKEFKRPVEGVLVFIGTGYRECETDESGRCSIEGFVWGSYSLNAYKKGYTHYTNSTNFEKGDSRLTIELERQPEAPESFTVEGIVIETITAKGSKSENRYLKVQNAGGDYYLFNRYGLNFGFSGYIGKTVRITGYNGTGSIGWQSQKTEGIYVEEISSI